MPVTSDLNRPPLFQHEAGGLLTAPEEFKQGTIVLVGLAVEDWRAITLTVQGEQIQCSRSVVEGTETVCAPWKQAAAGTWRVGLALHGTLVSHLVQVPPSKLSDSQLKHMIDDLEHRLPASVVLSLNRLGAFAELDWVPGEFSTLEQELERVRRAVDGGDGNPGLASVLTEIARHPHSIVTTEERWTVVQRAQRPHPGRLASALARPGNLLSPTIPARVVDRRGTLVWDVYENRLLREFSDQVDWHLRRLERCVEGSEKFAKAHRGTLAGLRSRLTAGRQRASFLDEVGQLRAAPNELTQVLLRRPAYTAALEGYYRFKAVPRVRYSHPAMDAPIRNVPALYEAWAALLLLDAVLAAAKRADWLVEKQLLVKVDTLGFAIGLLPGGVLVELRRGCATALYRYQHCIAVGGSKLRSVSFEQRPDVTLEVYCGIGERALHVLDPKYKLTHEEDGEHQPKKEDIDKMHAYRDAIRDATGRHVVKSAAILFPGVSKMFDGEVAALGAVPSEPNSELQTWVSALLAVSTSRNDSYSGEMPA